MIYLVIDGREMLVNEDDSNDIMMLSIRFAPKWVQVTIGTFSTGYKCIKINKTLKSLHRVIYHAHNQEWNISDVSKNNLIDHIDGDKTNNNISNLRVVTSQQNSFNTRAKGISWNKCAKKWMAQIYLNRKKIHLGYFETEEEARNAYLEAKKIYHIMPQLVPKS
tara:strand:+ start:18 stop:509 length:492 start_codon:yes stop_codon:yes gene_type:complete